MMRYRFAIPIALLLLSFTGITISQTVAQTGTTCPQLVQQALEAVGNNCSGMGRNRACYGFTRVEATFSTEMPVEFFTQPADLANLPDLQAISTAPLRVESSEWGIAVLNVQADLPNSLPGESATYLLLGDVVVENAVDPAGTNTTAQTFSVSTTGETIMRTRPTRAANVSATIPDAIELEADRISDDGGWLRVVYDDLAGWIERDQVTSKDDVSRLPTPSTAAYTPMQAIRLTTGLLGLSCTEAPPSILVVQGPQRVTINLTINGAELNIGSTIALWLSSAGTMVLAVIDGGVYTPDGTYIPAGFIAEVPVDASGNVTGDWSQPRPMTLEEWRLLEPLENIPESVLRYPIEIPAELIANSEVATATPVPPPPTNPPPPRPTSPPQIIQVDCAGLRPTSPTDGLPFGPVTFYWDGVSSPAVTGYRVNLYRDGALVTSLQSPAGTTNVSGDLSGIPVGGSYSWEVQALVNDLAVCTASINVSLAREFPPNAPPAPAPVCGNRICERALGENYLNCFTDCPN
jgi:hypothetical protein